MEEKNTQKTSTLSDVAFDTYVYMAKPKLIWTTKPHKDKWDDNMANPYMKEVDFDESI